MGDRSAEYGHDAVANVLVDIAAVIIDDSVNVLEKAPEHGVQLLSLELSAQPYNLKGPRRAR
jgi:oligoribonuclease (3'-5' exoribonuclease)